MRLHRIRLRNYGGVAESDVTFASTGVAIVEGPNEAGKTSLAHALQLAIEYPDSSTHSQIKSVKPADRDEGPEVEFALSSGEYELEYCIRWLKSPQTTLRITAPGTRNFTGREAHDRLQEILDETLDEQLWAALRIEQSESLASPRFDDVSSLGRALDRAAGGDITTDREVDLWERICREYEKYWTPKKGQVSKGRKDLQGSVEKAKHDVEDLEQEIGELENASQQIDLGEASADALGNGAALIETAALVDITVRIDNEEIEVPAGGVERTLVGDEVTVVIADIVRMRVSAPTDSRDRRKAELSCLRDRRDDSIRELQYLAREHERNGQRASAARLLKDMFDKHRSQARQRYKGPFKQAIEQLGQIVYGPTFAVEVSEDLQVVSRALQGTTLSVDRLSHGTREQIAVLSRLACAAIVSPEDGGVPVIIDDALGWSDPQRLRTMGAAIATAGKKCQVILLTCTPGRYCHIEGAQVERL